MIKIAYEENISKLYYDDLSKRKFQNEGNKTLEEIFNEKFKIEFDCSLNDLLSGSFEELEAIKNRLGNCKEQNFI